MIKNFEKGKTFHFSFGNVLWSYHIIQHLCSMLVHFTSILLLHHHILHFLLLFSLTLLSHIFLSNTPFYSVLLDSTTTTAAAAVSIYSFCCSLMCTTEKHKNDLFATLKFILAKIFYKISSEMTVKLKNNILYTLTYI